MEEYGSLMSLVDGMASDFLFIDGREIDMISAGKFLNNLDELIKEADSQNVFQLKKVAGGLNSLLEKMFLMTLMIKNQVLVSLKKDYPDAGDR